MLRGAVVGVVVVVVVVVVGVVVVGGVVDFDASFQGRGAVICMACQLEQDLRSG